MSINNNEVISKASPHTIKKFELIEKYVETWAQKLLQNQYCDTLIFIDCMCNSGEYRDENNQVIYGTPVRVSRVLRNAAGQYPGKQIYLYFNDISREKVSHLGNLVGKEKSNFHVNLSNGDGNELLKRMGQALPRRHNIHYLLIYDPYDATINWDAIMPFLNNWGEVIINHMLSDSIRAVKMAKSDAAKQKYEQTYLTSIDSLIPYGSDKAAYESRIEHIINTLRHNRTRRYYIAAYPFFNSRNAIVYNLIHCTSNLKGFKLYKQTAWQTFGGKSSTKNTYGNEDQFVLDFSGSGLIKPQTDEYCYYIKDIADYIQAYFDGKSDIPLATIWNVLDEHPVFPSDGFKSQIKKELKQRYGVIESRGKMSFKVRS